MKSEASKIASAAIKAALAGETQPGRLSAAVRQAARLSRGNGRKRKPDLPCDCTNCCSSLHAALAECSSSLGKCNRPLLKD